MLTHLYVQNFAIANVVEADFHAGMTVITGETGAGKSILLDAIGLTLGDRADANSIGPFGDKANITASFDISANSEAQAWLAERELSSDDECVLRRVLNKDGKSKAFINNCPSPVSEIRELGELLINIHGQHAHQSLLKAPYQRQTLDSFGNYPAALAATQSHYQQWQQLQEQYDALVNNAADSSARADFLKFQLDELNGIPLSPDEFDATEQELHTLNHAETVIQICEQAESGSSDAVSQLLLAKTQLAEMPVAVDEIIEAGEMLNSALIQAQEAAANIQHYQSGIEIDEQRLQLLDQQLGQVFAQARKHRVEPRQLASFETELQAEFESLDNSDEKLAALAAEVAAAKQHYMASAAKLSALRKKAATALEKAIEQHLNELKMANCRIVFDLEAAKPSEYGLEKVQLLAATNPGQSPQSIAKVASGGELSRIGLAIQVVTAQTNGVPAMIFDEVDAGVGGAVAEVVGNLMRQLSGNAQIFCVTHLAQVASKAHNHYVVSKETDDASVETRFESIDDKQRVDEIARMLGGLTITEQTIAHAKTMLVS